MKLGKLYLAAMLVACVGYPAQAAITFDPDGGFGNTAPIPLAAFDWLVGNAMSDNGNTAVVDFLTPPVGTIQTPSNFFYQARLSSTIAPGGAVNTPANLGAGGAHELTLVAAATEIVTGATGVGPGTVATFALAAPGDQTVNYFEIWFDPTRDANDLQGTGFNNHGAVAAGAFGTGTNDSLVADLDSVLVLSGRATFLTSSFTAIPPGTTTGSPNLDQNIADNYAGIDSVDGTGSTLLVMEVSPLYFNPAFFPGLLSIDLLTFSSEVGVPFTSIDPSARFLMGAGGAGLGISGGTLATAVSPGVVPTFGTAGAGSNGGGAGQGPAVGGSLGDVNGGSVGGVPRGPDVQFNVDGSSSLQGTLENVPEPSSVVIFSVLFAGVGICALRRRRKA